jgi:hypothetical protein
MFRQIRDDAEDLAHHGVEPLRIVGRDRLKVMSPMG